jgi:hypothetical protein
MRKDRRKIGISESPNTIDRSVHDVNRFLLIDGSKLWQGNNLRFCAPDTHQMEPAP